jgi:hypothetical protein
VQEKFECVICRDEQLVDDVALLEECGHKFCRECLRNYIGSRLEDGVFPVLCPLCSADKTKNPASKLSVFK